MRRRSRLPLLLPLLLAATGVPAHGAGTASPTRAGALAPTPTPPGDDVDRLLADLASNGPQRKQARDELERRGRALVPRLLPLLDHSSYAVRWDAVNLLGRYRDPRGAPGLVERAIADSSPHVRWRAIWALDQLEPEGKDLARSLLFKEMSATDKGRAWNAAVALADAGDARAVPAISAGLDGDEEWRLWEAVSSLGKVHDAETGARLLKLASKKGESMRTLREIAVTAGTICDGPSKEALALLLDDRDYQVRWRAADALGKCDDRAQRPILLKRQGVEKVNQVKDAIASALKRIGE